MTVYRPYPLSGQVDTTKVPLDIITETEPKVKSLMIQNTHATQNLSVYLFGQGNASITLYPHTNITLSVENDDRIGVRKIYLAGSGNATTYEILSLIGPTQDGVELQ